MAFFPERVFFDDPDAVSPVVARFLSMWDETMRCGRLRLPASLAHALPGTRSGQEVELKRSWMVVDWYCRVSTPAWLRLAGLAREAAAIEAREPIRGPETARAAVPALEAAGRRLSLAHDEARREAGEIGRAVARMAAAMGVPDARPFAMGSHAREAAAGAAADAATAAVTDAALVAALYGAGVPPEAALRAFADGAFTDLHRAAGAHVRGDPGMTAALAAATDVTRAAVMTAALSATRRALWPAAFLPRAWSRLKPTVRGLQGSALALIERMVALSGQNCTS